MKRIIFLLAGLLLLCFPKQLFAQESWTITSFDSYIEVQSDGTVAVNETIDVDFNNLSKHGIYRDIPVVYQDDTGEKVYTKIQVLKIKQDNTEAEYKVMDNEYNLRIRIGDPDETITGKHTYMITYLATGILRSYTDHDELYWNVTGNDWEADIQKATATVVVPKERIQRVICYEGYTGSRTECKSSQPTFEKAVFANNEPLASRMGITIVAGLTKGMVPILTIEPPKKIEDELFSYPSLMSLIIALVGGIGGVTWLWLKNGRDLWFKTRQILDPHAPQEVMPVGAHEATVVEFEPPEKLRPAEIGVLMDERADTLDITATIVDLANRGYLTITEIPKRWLFGSIDYELQQIKDDTESLIGYEKMLLNRLFSAGKTVKVSELKTTFYDDLAEVKKKLYSDVMRLHLFAANPESTRHTYIGLGVLGMVIGGGIMYVGFMIILGPLVAFGFGTLASGVILSLASVGMPRRTAVGRELYQRTKGYQLFISNAEKYRQQFFEKKNMFNEVLPYAIIFGLTGKFAQAMKDMGIQPTQPGWYHSARPFNAGMFVSDVNGFSSSLSTAIASTPSKSGGFSGGGSSGGGFGGGGGGSW